MSDGPADPDALARRPAQFIAEGTGIAEQDVAIVLGSGWAPAVAVLGSATAVLPMVRTARLHPSDGGRPHRSGVVPAGGAPSRPSHMSRGVRM